MLHASKEPCVACWRIRTRICHSVGFSLLSGPQHSANVRLAPKSTRWRVICPPGGYLKAQPQGSAAHTSWHLQPKSKQRMPQLYSIGIKQKIYQPSTCQSPELKPPRLYASHLWISMYQLVCSWCLEHAPPLRNRAHNFHKTFPIDLPHMGGGA